VKVVPSDVVGPLGLVGALGLIVAALLALSGVIISRRPEAQRLVDKLVPYQGFLGVGLLAWGILYLVLRIGLIKLWFDAWPLGGTLLLATTLCAALLGFLFGMPLIAQWIPGDSPAEQKALEMQQKIASFAVLLGMIGMIAAIGVILMVFGVLTPQLEYKVGSIGG
jgi:hypothetical protein